ISHLFSFLADEVNQSIIISLGFLAEFVSISCKVELGRQKQPKLQRNTWPHLVEAAMGWSLISYRQIIFLKHLGMSKRVEIVTQPICMLLLITIHSLFVVKCIQHSEVMLPSPMETTIVNPNVYGYKYVMLRKSIEIHFSATGNYVVLKYRPSRVVQVARGRSYHIFYQLCAGAPSDLRGSLLLFWFSYFNKKLKLRTAYDYHYLNQSKCLTVNDIDDADRFHKLNNTMDTKV
ncbi:hypothetical protein Leryth_010099, partial [Lithospermum erythrorhizon]